MRILLISAVALSLAACGSAAGRIAPEALGVSARDASLEARTVARSWSPDARLRWVQGQGIAASGRALPDQGHWEFHYTAPGQAGELMVRIASLETSSTERAATSPPGFVIGDNALGGDWIDSGEALAAVAAAAGELPAPATLLLVPTEPMQWIVRVGDTAQRWRIHARTGEVLAR